jgi:glycosyltransferase involved in cell wall biosynthesis
MHDVLWKSYAHSLEPCAGILGLWKRWAVRRYKAEEERAWTQFDALVAINRDEERLVRGVLGDSAAIFHAPMGTDLTLWSYGPEPASPPRLAYYGGLGNAQNEQSALRCAAQIMPAIWDKVPDAELWLIGSSPSASLRRLTRDSRVRVTGFVEDVQQVLRTMSAVLCPWTGTFGFRSRLIEVMALGVPVVVSPDAVHGMELQKDRGVLLGETDAALANQALRLIIETTFARDQSRMARDQIERGFSLENTYDSFVMDLHRWLRTRNAGARTAGHAPATPLEFEPTACGSGAAQV